MTETVPDRTRTPTLRIASVPEDHVYVRHLGAVDGSDSTRRLPDPPPDDPDAFPGQWWPPRMLSPDWVREHRAEFDVMHVQFGFDAQSAQTLASLVAELRRWDKRLVYTAHDLRNPHHIDRRAHDEHLDVLIPQADEVVTLTSGAAAEIERRWGRRPVVLPHPHVIEFERFGRRPAGGDGWTVGVHAKSVRASMVPLPVIAAIADVVRELPGARLQVNVHHDVADAEGLRHDPALMRWLREAASDGVLDLFVHDCFSDEELWQYLESLDLSVLPYRFGTHSGWLEACFDLGTTVLAPTCGFIAQQRPCLTYRHDERGLDVSSLQAAVRTAYEQRPLWQASLADRRQERAELAAAHRTIYEAVLR
ncbi:glycosyltransferase [Blastococcus sp. CT_GayMR16]|uniref:glycosyltransferase n=1 Tax=Blastococcus sp. CT_GayMR16 TaxID=2559607 RepID=UPI00107433C3|nr:glycosyltransferase [Blastococcus sp. CT_GayMR16]TFV91066.1 glycosyltransferase family 1 protein [Blastococcus sp. CT_GayMR16]